MGHGGGDGARVLSGVGADRSRAVGQARSLRDDQDLAGRPALRGDRADGGPHRPGGARSRRPAAGGRRHGRGRFGGRGLLVGGRRAHRDFHGAELRQRGRALPVRRGARAGTRRQAGQAADRPGWRDRHRAERGARGAGVRDGHRSEGRREWRDPGGDLAAGERAENPCRTAEPALRAARSRGRGAGTPRRIHAGPVRWRALCPRRGRSQLQRTPLPGERHRALAAGERFGGKRLHRHRAGHGRRWRHGLCAGHPRGGTRRDRGLGHAHAGAYRAAARSGGRIPMRSSTTPMPARRSARATWTMA